MPKEKKRDKNIFKKKTEKINHKNISKEKTNDDIFKINNNYNTSSSVFNNRDFKNKNKKNEEDLKTNNCYNNNSTNMSNNINDYYLNDKPMNMMYSKNNNYDFEDESFIASGRGNGTSRINSIGNRYIFSKSNDDNINNLIISKDKKLYINFNSIKIDKNDYNKNKRKYNKLKISRIDSINIKPVKIKDKGRIINLYSNGNCISYREKPERINMCVITLLKKRKINNGITKLKCIINNEIKETKSIFLNYLKKTFILSKIIKNITNKKLKLYFIKYKKLTKIKSVKKPMHVSFKEIIPIVEEYNTNDNTKKKRVKFEFLLPKQNEFNFISPKKINKLQGKEKLKFLIKQIYQNNNRINNNYTDRNFSDEDKSLKKENSSFENDKKAQTNKDIPVCQSVEDRNMKNAYYKKNFNKNKKE
jgi:hypothetical protein